VAKDNYKWDKRREENGPEESSENGHIFLKTTQDTLTNADMSIS
jgi:hypothetical protein